MWFRPHDEAISRTSLGLDVAAAGRRRDIGQALTRRHGPIVAGELIEHAVARERRREGLLRAVLGEFPVGRGADQPGRIAGP